MPVGAEPTASANLGWQMMLSQGTTEKVWNGKTFWRQPLFALWTSFVDNAKNQLSCSSNMSGRSIIVAAHHHDSLPQKDSRKILEDSMRLRKAHDGLLPYVATTCVDRAWERVERILEG